MLYGTDLSSAYSFDFDPTPKPAPAKPVQVPSPKKEERVETPPMDPNFLTSDQKLHLLTSEIQKQKEMVENSKNNNYIDKMLSKKKDVMKLLVISFVFLLAMSLHSVIEFYLRKYLEENVLGAGKELLVRLLYPASILLILWNMKVFNK
jgi:hypothetical protein